MTTFLGPQGWSLYSGLTVLLLFITELNFVILSVFINHSPVDEVHLSDDIDKVQYVADEVFDGVEVVHVERVLHVLHQSLARLLALFKVQSAA
jgi:hypothetical protein